MPGPSLCEHACLPAQSTGTICVCVLIQSSQMLAFLSRRCVMLGNPWNMVGEEKNLSNFITDILRCTAVEKHIGIFPIWINALAFSPVFDPKYAMCSLIRKNEMNQYAQQIWLTSACIVLLESFLPCIVFGFGLNETFPHDHWIDYQKCLLTEPPHGSSITFDLSQLLVSGMSKVPEPAHQQVQISLIDGNVKCEKKEKQFESAKQFLFFWNKLHILIA